ncbi:hypothetical protein N7539_009095 [Penicillium diatomitis]|uniref:Uncharacterized protein n=1 Tax=Penicillium diatomitis TaxID=2819901 RepID=A0A9X0BJQ9_9EURO|nr:uncharacterized protein N7539_009095 [Penicillium diatomitis]KAJ5469477.1 hypothetical protein N7539_009095 [Penicillium diatomitis]
MTRSEFTFTQAMQMEELQEQLQVAGTWRRLRGPLLSWWFIRECLERVPGEMCYIFDCCSAGLEALATYEGAECLAATAWDQKAAATLQYPFTQVVIPRL